MYFMLFMFSSVIINMALTNIAISLFIYLITIATSRQLSPITGGEHNTY